MHDGAVERKDDGLIELQEAYLAQELLILFDLHDGLYSLVPGLTLIDAFLYQLDEQVFTVGDLFVLVTRFEHVSKHAQMSVLSISVTEDIHAADDVVPSGDLQMRGRGLA